MTVAVEPISPAMWKEYRPQDTKTLLVLFLSYKMRIRVMIFLMIMVSGSTTILIQHCVYYNHMHYEKQLLGFKSVLIQKNATHVSLSRN